PATALKNPDFAAGFDGWQSSGDGFAVFTGADGARRVTTFVSPKGDDVMGRLWQDFTVDDKTSEIDFAVHGGPRSGRRYHGADLVRSTHGRDTNDVELPVRWQIAMFRGETLRLVIDDDQTGAWGFIGTTGFRLR